MPRRKNTTPSSKSPSAKKGSSTRKRSAALKAPLLVDGLEVQVTRKRIKNVHLRVKPPSAESPEGRVEISTPYGTPDAFIAGFVRERRAWIEEQRQKLSHSPRATAATASP